MQQEMLRVQTELESATVDGSSGGGVVSATVTGKQELVSLTIDPSAVGPRRRQMLQDLVVAGGQRRDPRLEGARGPRRWPRSPAA
jgi:DNA-binding protein YbaB